MQTNERLSTDITIAFNILDQSPMATSKQDETPGPGAYYYRTQSVLHSPKFTMQKAERKSVLVRKVDYQLPGVGIYSPKPGSGKHHAPVFSMGRRIEERTKTKMGASSPGPAAYLTGKNASKRAISMPRERRPLGNSSEKRFGANKFNVGPGQYQLESIFEKRKAAGQKFSTDADKRSLSYIEPHLRQINSNPGPGSYNPALNKIGKKVNSKRSSRGLNKKGRGSSFSRQNMSILGGIAKRDTVGLSDDRIQFPGPADYDSRGPGMAERLRRKGLT